MIIPQSALQEDQTGPYVFIVDDKKVVQQKYVKQGVVFGENIVITSGLNQGELVISQGFLKVKPGIEVSYVMQNKGADTTTHPSVTPVNNSVFSDTPKSAKN